jgi:hypothetical protein
MSNSTANIKRETLNYYIDPKLVRMSRLCALPSRTKFSAKRSSFNFEIASFSSYFCKAKEKKLPANFILALNIRAPYLLVAIAGIDLFPFGSGK